MDVNISIGEKQDGVTPALGSSLPPPSGELANAKPRTGNRKRRRAKHKRKVTKPFARPRAWNAERRLAGEERRRRVRPKPLNETGAPYNNNQFLMEIHAPSREPRTRDSSFSVDSEENYLYSLPEDEEEFLTKEFSSVYEDAACERLAGLSKAELLQEYLALEARYESASRGGEADLRRRLRETEQRLRELEAENEKLRQQVERLQRASSSADSESDSSSSLSTASSPCPLQPLTNGHVDIEVDHTNGVEYTNGDEYTDGLEFTDGLEQTDGVASPIPAALCNGVASPPPAALCNGVASPLPDALCNGVASPLPDALCNGVSSPLPDALCNGYHDDEDV